MVIILAASGCTGGSGDSRDPEVSSSATAVTDTNQKFCEFYRSEKAAYIAKYQAAQSAAPSEGAAANLVGALVGTAEALYDIKKMFEKFEESAPKELESDLAAINTQLAESMDTAGAVDDPAKALTKSLALSFQTAPAWSSFDKFLTTNCGEPSGSLFGVSGNLTALDQFPGYGVVYSDSATGRIDESTWTLSVLLAATETHPTGGEVVNWTPEPVSGAVLTESSFDLAEQGDNVTAVAVVTARIPASGLKSADEGKYLMAYDVRAKKVVSTTELPQDARYAGAAGDIVVTTTGDESKATVQAYDLTNGRRLWSKSGLSNRIAVAPPVVVAHDFENGFNMYHNGLLLGLDLHSGAAAWKWQSKFDSEYRGPGIGNLRWWPGGDVVFQTMGLVHRASDGEFLLSNGESPKDNSLFYDPISGQFAAITDRGLKVKDVASGRIVRSLTAEETSALGLSLHGFYDGNLWIKTTDSNDIVDAKTGDVVVSNWVLYPRTGGKTWVSLQGPGKRGVRLFDDGKFDPTWTTVEEGVS